MVSLGYIPHEKAIPSPDMSFVRLFSDISIGWQLRGQYAIWNGASREGRSKYRLLERIGNRVAPIFYADGSPVFHRIGANVPFLVEGLAGFWLSFDSDTMWLDTPAPEGQFALLDVGGAAGRPGRAVVDWTCPSCGSSINPRSFDIPPLAFAKFLKQADDWAAAASEDASLRTCSHCQTVHPAVPGLIHEEQAHSATETAGA